jgi:hypothetical protein
MHPIQPCAPLSGVGLISLLLYIVSSSGPCLIRLYHYMLVRGSFPPTSVSLLFDLPCCVTGLNGVIAPFPDWRFGDSLVLSPSPCFIIQYPFCCSRYLTYLPLSLPPYALPSSSISSYIIIQLSPIFIYIYSSLPPSSSHITPYNTAPFPFGVFFCPSVEVLVTCSAYCRDWLCYCRVCHYALFISYFIL